MSSASTLLLLLPNLSPAIATFNFWVIYLSNDRAMCVPVLFLDLNLTVIFSPLRLN